MTIAGSAVKLRTTSTRERLNLNIILYYHSQQHNKTLMGPFKRAFTGGP